MYKDPKSFIHKYLEKYSNEIKDFKNFKAEVEERMKDPEITEREKLESMYFLYYLEKNMKNVKKKIGEQRSVRDLGDVGISPRKEVESVKALTPEKRKTIKSLISLDKEGIKKNSVSMSHAYYGPIGRSETNNSSEFSNKPVSEIREKFIKNSKNSALFEENNLSFRSYNSKIESSPTKQSVKSFPLYNNKKVNLPSDSIFGSDEANISTQSISTSQPKVLKKLKNIGKIGVFPKIPINKSASVKKTLPSRHKNLIEPKPLENKDKSDMQSLSLIQKKSKFIRKPGPCKHIYHFSPITKLSLIDHEYKGLIQSSSIPTIDESKKLNLVLRSASLEKKKNFKQFQLVKLFDF